MKVHLYFKYECGAMSCIIFVYVTAFSSYHALIDYNVVGYYQKQAS